MFSITRERRHREAEIGVTDGAGRRDRVAEEEEGEMEGRKRGRTDKLRVDLE